MRQFPTIRLVIFILMAAILIPGFTIARDQTKNRDIPAKALPAKLVSVIDGDTIRVRLASDRGNGKPVTVRLIGIDTPETTYAYGNHPECYGTEASKRTEFLLKNASDQTVWLEKDVSETDKNGRLLRYVWYESTADGEIHLLNEQLVREGYALAKTYRPDTTRQKDLDAAEQKAIQDKLGMWSACSQ